MDLSDFEIIVVYVRNRRVEEEKNIRLNILFPFDSKEVKICFNVCFFFSYFPVFFHRSLVNLMIVLLCIFINAFHFNSNMLYKIYICTNFFIFLNFIYFMDKDEIRGKNLYSFKFGLLCDVTFYIQYFKNILVL